MTIPPLRLVVLALGLGLAPLLTGCGSGDNDKLVSPPDNGLPVDTPANDSPQNTMTRFQRTYEYQVQPEYVKLLTNDFRYTFSADTDPTLVAQYGDTWRKSNESNSSAHLFNGYTSLSTGQYVPGATAITMSLNAVQDSADAEHRDSTSYYRRVIVLRVVMAIEVSGSPDPVNYNIDSRQEFYLVRGDAAVLGPGQTGTSNQWYIRRWDDLSATLASPSDPTTNPSPLSTWGHIKALYLL